MSEIPNDLKCMTFSKNDISRIENEAYNQALEDFSKKMKEVNLTNSFVLYYGDEIDLEEFMILASDEIKEQLIK